MKKILQIFAAIVYTFVFSALLYLVMVIPLAWFFGLSVFWQSVLLVLFIGLAQGIILGAQAVITAPYSWIVRQNIVALVSSIGILVFNIGKNIIHVWQLCSGGFWIVLFCISATVLLLEALIATTIVLIGFYQENESPSPKKPQKQKPPTTKSPEHAEPKKETPSTNRATTKILTAADGFPPAGSVIEFASNNLRIRRSDIKPHRAFYLVLLSSLSSITLKSVHGPEITLTKEQYYSIINEPGSYILLHAGEKAKKILQEFEQDEPTLFDPLDFPPVGTVIRFGSKEEGGTVDYLVVQIDGDQMIVEDDKENERLVTWDLWRKYKEEFNPKLLSQNDLLGDNFDFRERFGDLID